MTRSHNSKGFSPILSFYVRARRIIINETIIFILQFPDGEESSSAFVFIPENARELPVKFPVKGRHKICRFMYHIR